MRLRFLTLALLLLCCGQWAVGQDTNATARPAATDAEAERAKKLETATKEIRTAIKAYLSAFNNQDVDALSKMWTADCVYSVSGNRVVGRDAIVKQFKTALTAEGAKPKLAIDTQTIQFISPSVAIERGAALVTRGDNPEELTEYSAVYVKEGGRWLIDRVTEEEVVIRASNYEYLAELEWMIGDWIDVGEDFAVEIECQWTSNQNFIARKYKVATAEGDYESSGLQIIGWDAKQKQIRSWLFDSAGGFVKGVWTKRDNRWLVQSVANLPDGTSGSFTSIFSPQDEGSYTWQKINRVREGKLLPNIREVTVQRR